MFIKRSTQKATQLRTKEKEVVLEFNQKLTGWMNGEKVTINTGTRSDEWVKNIK